MVAAVMAVVHMQKTPNIPKSGGAEKRKKRKLTTNHSTAIFIFDFNFNRNFKNPLHFLLFSKKINQKAKSAIKAPKPKHIYKRL